MGDRLTLETAEQRVMEFIREDYESLGRLGPDEPTARAVDFAEALGALAQAAAADAVRAYRERLPEHAPVDDDQELRDVYGESRRTFEEGLVDAARTAVAATDMPALIDPGRAIEILWERTRGPRERPACSCLDTGAYHEDPPPCPVHGGQAGPRLLEVVPGVIRDLHRLAPGLGSVLQAALTADRRGPRVDVEALRSLLADLADGVRPIDREEVSRRIGEALGDTPSDPTPSSDPRYTEDDVRLDLACALDEIDRLNQPAAESPWVELTRAKLNGEPWYPGTQAGPRLDSEPSDPTPEPVGGAPTGPGWWWWELHQELPSDMPRRPVHVFEFNGALRARLFENAPLLRVAELDRWGGPCIQGSPQEGTE